MSSNFFIDVPDEVEADFRRLSAGEDLDEVMTALLKRAVFVRRFYDSDEAMVSALRAGDVQFSPLRLR